MTEKNERLDLELKDQIEKNKKSLLDKEEANKEESLKSQNIIEDQNEIISRMENLLNNERYRTQKLERELEMQIAIVAESGKVYILLFILFKLICFKI